MKNYTMLVFPVQVPAFTRIIHAFGGTIQPCEDYPALSAISVPDEVELRVLQQIRDGLEMIDRKFYP